MLKNNEKGSTLVMVLLLVVVITILGASLFTMNMSASKQFTNKEEQVQARHLAEMGVMHYKAVVEDVVDYENDQPIKYEEKFKENNPEETEIDWEKTLRTYLNRLCTEIEEIEVNDFHERTGTDGYIVKRLESDCSGTEQLVFTIESEGKINGTDRKIEADVVVAPNLENNNPGKDPEDGDETEVEEEDGEDKEDGGEGDKFPPLDKDYIIGQNENQLNEIIVSNKKYYYKEDVDVSGIIKVGGVDNIGHSALRIAGNLDLYGNLEIGHGMWTTNEVIIEGNFKSIQGATIGNGPNNETNVVIGGNFDANGTLQVGWGAPKKVCVLVYGDLDLGFNHLQTGGNAQVTVYGKSRVLGANYEEGHVFGNPNLECPSYEINPHPDPSPTDPINPTPSESDDFKWIVNPDVDANYFPENKK